MMYYYADKTKRRGAINEQAGGLENKDFMPALFFQK